MSDRANACVTIANQLGLHARPAMMFAETAGRFKADVKIKRGEQEIDGKSVMEIMLLAATNGTELEIVALGPDAEECLRALCTLVERGFDEE